MILNTILSLVLRIPTLNWIYWKIYKLQVNRIIKKGPIGISIETYNKCNYSCNICPLKGSSRKEYLMPMGLYTKILKDAKEEGITKLNLSIYGEPLLDHLLFERIKLAKKEELSVSFYSNASLMDKSKRLDIIKSGLDRIFFSVDAFTQETYSKVRSNGDLFQVVDNILQLIHLKEELHSKTPEIVVTFVVQNENRREIGAFKDFWKDKVDSIEFNEVDDRNKNISSIGKKLCRSDLYVFPCIRVFISPQVQSDGKVTLCCMDCAGEYLIGDLNTQSIHEIYESLPFTEYANIHMSRKANTLGICTNCQELYKYSKYIWWDAK